MGRVTVGEIELNTVDCGQGEPLLLVHGFPLDHRMWRAQIADLSADYRVIAPDLRGFGASDVSQGTVTMARFADDLVALLAALGVEPPVTVCGLSMGGYIVWQLWQRHRAWWRRLVLCDTRAEADSAEAIPTRRRHAQRVLAEGPGFLVQTMSQALCSPTFRQRDPECWEEVRKMIASAPPPGVAAALLGMAERADATSLLETINVPTLVLCGEDDTISPPATMRRLAARIPHAEYREIPSAGHLAPLENAGAVNRALHAFFSAGDGPSPNRVGRE